MVKYDGVICREEVKMVGGWGLGVWVVRGVSYGGILGEEGLL